MEDTIATVRQYYDLLSRQEYAEAYRLLSPEYQRRSPALSYLTACLAIASLHVASITRGSTPDRVAVSVLVTGIDERSAWLSGEWGLVRGGDTWLLDTDSTERTPFERPNSRMDRYALMRRLLLRGSRARTASAPLPEEIAASETAAVKEAA
jgi:hypothetical protein